MKTFRIGGVHPAENKLSAAEPIKIADLPKIAVFPMGQHIGAPAKPIVKKGDKVKVGQMIAEAGGFVSAPIFSSVSGTVLKVDTVVDASGYAKPAVYITVEGDEWDEAIDRSDKLVTLKDKPELTGKEIIEKIQKAGIVGMGGACFPCHVKLMPPPGSKPEWVIINAVECEPYLTADHRLMLEKADQILVGVSLLMKAANVNKGYIGIESNKPDAIKLMQEKVSAYPNIEVVPLKVKYPQGGEKQLIDAVVGRQVPAPPALPVSVGAIIQNVGTAYAVYEAVMKNKPLFERVVTVTGKSLKQPSNFLTRMGTPMSQLIDACGGLPEDTGKVIGGGPMMGKALMNIEVPICKGSSGVLIMNDKEARRGEPQPCIRCAKCVGACPMGLEPYLLATCSGKGMWEKVEAEDITSCIECGSCQFTCPSNRPMLDLIRLGKSTVMGIIRARNAKK
ncbi:MAG: electron transport complex subunit RsxC [Prevotellaceae bacterium]|nr:electron transport complex subunit RsxC [Prevotellaceae bacterium]